MFVILLFLLKELEEINIEKDKVTKKLNEYMDKVIEDLEYRKD